MEKFENASRSMVEAYAKSLGASFCAVQTGEVLVGHVTYKGTESPLVAILVDQPDYLAKENIEKIIDLLKRVVD